MEAMAVPWSGRRQRRQRRRRAEGIVHFLIARLELVLVASFTELVNHCLFDMNLYIHHFVLFGQSQVTVILTGTWPLIVLILPPWTNQRFMICLVNVAFCYWTLFVSLTWSNRVFAPAPRDDFDIQSPIWLNLVIFSCASVDDRTANVWLTDVAWLYWTTFSPWRGEVKRLWLNSTDLFGCPYL